MRAAAHGPIDMVLDTLPPAAGAGPVRTAAMTVREYGRVVLMGGVGMADGAELALPYPRITRNSITIRGQWMYPPHANTRMIALTKAGLLDLDQFDITEFALDDANQAINHAADNSGAFKLTVIGALTAKARSPQDVQTSGLSPRQLRDRGSRFS
jgi:alcohol dehydrogenase